MRLWDASFPALHARRMPQREPGVEPGPRDAGRPAPRGSVGLGPVAFRLWKPKLSYRYAFFEAALGGQQQAAATQEQASPRGLPSPTWHSYDHGFLMLPLCCVYFKLNFGLNMIMALARNEQCTSCHAHRRGRALVRVWSAVGGITARQCLELELEL